MQKVKCKSQILEINETYTFEMYKTNVDQELTAKE